MNITMPNFFYYANKHTIYRWQIKYKITKVNKTYMTANVICVSGYECVCVYVYVCECDWVLGVGVYKQKKKK